MAAPKIVVYWRPTCPWAAEVRGVLDTHGVEYETRDIDGNAAFCKEMVAKTGQEKSPCVEIDGDMIVDVGGSEVEAFLTKKGVIGKDGKSSGGSSKNSCSLK